MKLQGINTIFKREFRSLFNSPAAYIIMTLFLVTAGWFFFSTYFLAGQVSMRYYFSLLPLILTFTIPALTMRGFSEEYRSGSYEILMTLPFSRWEIVLGKFFSALAMALVMTAPTLLYPLSVALTGELDMGPVIGGFSGALFLAASYTAIGLFASSLTGNQVVAFIISVSINFFLYILGSILALVPPFLAGILQFFSSSYHFESIAKGVIDSRDLLYFLSVTGTAIYLTHFVHREKN
jgi:ABC-2 type transport system permease protein